MVVVRAEFSHTGCAGVSFFEITFGCEAENMGREREEEDGKRS